MNYLGVEASLHRLLSSLGIKSVVISSFILKFCIPSGVEIVVSVLRSHTPSVAFLTLSCTPESRVRPGSRQFWYCEDVQAQEFEIRTSLSS